MKDLHMTALVDHLGCPIKLAVEKLHGLGHLRCGKERALLTMKKLAQHP